jgi:glycosyltransferase involved in cell wall biosynthesis
MTERRRNDNVISKRVGRNVLGAGTRISVIIPAYNVAEHISETLRSVVSQKFREYEIIVVNDGSPDTEKFEREINTYIEEIVYIKQKNAGASIARNTGIQHARGEIIAFLDGDDQWMPDFLASQYVFMGRHGLDMAYCDAYLFGDNSPYIRRFMETAPSDGDVTPASLLDLRCNVITSGTMVKRTVLNAAGNFDPDDGNAHDFLLWMRIAKNGGRIGYQKKVLAKYRVHLNSLSGDAVNRMERSIFAFERAMDTLELTADETAIAQKRLEGFRADLEVERGKSLLLGGEHREAAAAFLRANRRRRSLKLATVALMARFAPKLLLRVFKSMRSNELAFVRNIERSA